MCVSLCGFLSLREAFSVLILCILHSCLATSNAIDAMKEKEQMRKNAKFVPTSASMAHDLLKRGAAPLLLEVHHLSPASIVTGRSRNGSRLDVLLNGLQADKKPKCFIIYNVMIHTYVYIACC